MILFNKDGRLYFDSKCTDQVSGNYKVHTADPTVTVQDLSDFFTQGDTEYHLEKITPKKLLYRADIGDTSSYEVFEVRLVNKLSYVDGKFVNDGIKIAYPKSEDFGVWAWSTRFKDKALKLLNE